MKNTGKNRSGADSYNASEAARLLGVSIPTAKRMVADGTLEGFRTPGGHLRVSAEGIQALKDQRETQPRPVRDASAVLQNRRDRVEELTLEAQEVRARRDLAKLQGEEREEVERREAQAQARKEEAAKREAQLQLERQRLELEQVEEWARREMEENEQWARREAGQKLAGFQSRWLQEAQTIASYAKLRLSLSEGQYKEILDGLEAQIKRRTPEDEPRMSAILAQSVEALLEPMIATRTRQQQRQSIADRTVWGLSLFAATNSEKAQASEAIRKALAAQPDDASDVELDAAAEEAVRPIQKVAERRLLDTRMLNWAISQLPWGSDDRDRARVSRECREILADLPPEVSEPEAKEALEPTVTEVRQEIEQRQAEEDRRTRKANLIQQGVAEVSGYLLELKRQGEISDEEYCDTEFTGDLTKAVRDSLESQLTGAETAKEVRDLVREIVNQEADL